MGFRDNVVESFKKVKYDVNNLWHSVQFLREQHQEIVSKMNGHSGIDLAELSDLKMRIKKIESSQDNLRSAVSSVLKLLSRNKKMILNKNNHLLHDSTCPFAQKIKINNRQIIFSENQLLGTKFEKCQCLE